MIVVRLLIVTQLIRVVDSDHHTDSQKEPHLNPFKLEISNLSDTPLTGEGYTVNLAKFTVTSP